MSERNHLGGRGRRPPDHHRPRSVPNPFVGQNSKGAEQPLRHPGQFRISELLGGVLGGVVMTDFVALYGVDSEAQWRQLGTEAV